MTDRIRVLLIDDDREDFLIVSDMLSEVEDTGSSWIGSTYEAGLEAISRREHDVYLLDYFMGRHNGLELLNGCREQAVRRPSFFLRLMETIWSI